MVKDDSKAWPYQSSTTTENPECLHDYVHLKDLGNVLFEFERNMKPLDPEYSKVVDDHFWELI